MHLNPYLLFNGDCSEALKFYEEALGARVEAKMTFAGTPSAEQVPPEWGDKVLHGSRYWRHNSIRLRRTAGTLRRAERLISFALSQR
jgi:uncharacterized glyoxalase superfamily protein PhnB